MPQFEKDPSEIGALWSNTNNRGEYFTGNINGVGVVVFKNTNKKEGSKAPDWRVLKALVKTPADRPAPSDSDDAF